MQENPSETRKNPGGRPRKGDFSDEKLLEICARVATGDTLTAIAKEPGMPSPAHFRTLVMRSPQLRDTWETAKAERPHSLFEQAIDLARELRDTPWDREATNKVRALQIAIDALRTAAARLAPREYGERPAGQVVVPVQINTSLALDGRPATSGPSVYQIEAALPLPEK